MNKSQSNISESESRSSPTSAGKESLFRQPVVIDPVSGKRRVLKKKLHKSSNKTVFENIPSVSTAHTGAYQPTRQAMQTRSVFESIPKPSTAHTGAYQPPNKLPQTRSVFESIPKPSTAHTGLYQPPNQLPQTRSVYESIPKPSKADASALTPQEDNILPLIKTLSELEKSGSKESMESIQELQTHNEVKEGNKDEYLDINTDSTYQETKQSNLGNKQDQKRRNSGAFLSPTSFKSVAKIKSIFEKSGNQSVTSNDGNKTFKDKVIDIPATTKVEFCNTPEPSKAQAKWNDPWIPSPSKAVYENIPQPALVHASAIRDFSDSEYTYETDSEYTP